ncbi:MAG: hypothetical protein ACJAZ9_001713 [Neolewinella sp.]|jgi:hypothetical protein
MQQQQQQTVRLTDCLTIILGMTFIARLTEETTTLFRYHLVADGQLMTFFQVLEAWQHSPAFRTFYFGLLRDNPLPAYFWEHPPLTTETLSSVYEFSLQLSNGLQRVTENRRPFRFFFTEEMVVSFANLGKDAQLVVPCPKSANTIYTHLAIFLRTTTAEQADAFWQMVGREVVRRVGEQKLYLSTSGMGVHWLHARLDDRPKYYQDRKYRI